MTSKVIDFERFTKKKKVINKIIEKGYRNKPLTEEQIANNKEKSRTRVRVEHMFGFVENSMHGSIVRTIGIARAKAKIGMMNLTYNISRYTQLKIVVAMRYLPAAPLRSRFGRARPVGRGMPGRERDTFVSTLYLIK